MITVYSKNGCPYCVSAKALLEEWDIEFTEVLIDQNADAREFVLSEGHRSVPQLYIDQELLVAGGFDGLRNLSASYINEKLKD